LQTTADLKKDRRRLLLKDKNTEKMVTVQVYAVHFKKVQPRINADKKKA